MIPALFPCHVGGLAGRSSPKRKAGTIMNLSSRKNQRIKADFVSREVVACVSMWVEDSLKAGILNLKDIAPIYNVNVELETLGGNWFEGSTDERDEKIEELREKIGELETAGADVNADEIERCTNDVSTLETADEEPRVIYEFWLVSKSLFEDLRERGEAVVNSDYGHIWGRCTTGQSITVDSVISEICFSLKILEGQKNEWPA